MPLNNNFELPALTLPPFAKIGEQKELFFEWIKQFYGASENAVKTQIWISVPAYVLAAIIKSGSVRGHRSTH